MLSDTKVTFNYYAYKLNADKIQDKYLLCKENFLNATVLDNGTLWFRFRLPFK